MRSANFLQGAISKPSNPFTFQPVKRVFYRHLTTRDQLARYPRHYPTYAWTC